MKPASCEAGWRTCLKHKYELTAAQSEVLALSLEGRPVERIASIRNAQVITVRSQVVSMFDKTGLRSQRELIAAFGRSCVVATTSSSGSPLP